MISTIKLEAISKTVGDRNVLQSIDLSVAPGETVALVGQSGSGKTTLLSVLGLLDAADSGSYCFDGRNLQDAKRTEREHVRGRSIGFIFQRFALLPHLSAIENVMMPFRHVAQLSEGHEKPPRTRAFEELQRVGLGELTHRRPRQLSGGEQQRVAVARAIVHSPRIVLADEPTGSLDPTTGAMVVEILVRRVRETGSCLVIVTHDRAIAQTLDSIYSLTNGRLEATA